MDQKEKSVKLIDKNKLIVTIAVCTVLTGLFVIFQPYLQEKKELAYNSMVTDVYDNEVLTNLDNVLHHAENMKIIDIEQIKAIQQWQHKPSKWSK